MTGDDNWYAWLIQTAVYITANGDLGSDGLSYANSNGHTLTDDKGWGTTLTCSDENVQSNLVNRDAWSNINTATTQCIP